MDKTMGRLMKQYPIIREFLKNYNQEITDSSLTLKEYLDTLDVEELEEFGTDRDALGRQMEDFLGSMNGLEQDKMKVESLTIMGGHTKDMEPEHVRLELFPGDVVSIVGPTGSGKSRLLEDIECIAQGDTPTGRHIRINDKAVDVETRFDMSGKLVAQLSQNMNFVMDLSTEEFLRIHAQSRMCSNPRETAAVCLLCANQLAGEPFDGKTKVTQLSGGQSRALMIADTAYMSNSPIVLIDEIENAGVDRLKAIRLLADQNKIILISTHDPLLAISAQKRIVIKNGGIYKILETDSTEQRSLVRIQQLDTILFNLRKELRAGHKIKLGGEAYVGTV